jgi:hypothetical protein
LACNIVCMSIHIKALGGLLKVLDEIVNDLGL